MWMKYYRFGGVGMPEIKFGTVDKEFKNKDLIRHLRNILMRNFFNKDINNETLSVIVKVFAKTIDQYFEQQKKKVPFRVIANFDEHFDVVIDIKRK